MPDDLRNGMFGHIIVQKGRDELVSETMENLGMLLLDAAALLVALEPI